MSSSIYKVKERDWIVLLTKNNSPRRNICGVDEKVLNRVFVSGIG